MTAPPTTPLHDPETAAPGTEPVPAVADEVGCPACAHPLDAHDPIGARYCRATAAAGTEGRGCVCRVG